MSCKRSAEEIVARLDSLQGYSDFFGVQSNDLLTYLPYEHAKPFLKDGTNSDSFENAISDSRRKGPLAELKEYLDFAWDKANNCRGLSAGRSLDHIKTWLWLAGFDVDSHFEDYNCYGKKQLVMASLMVDFDWRAHDDGRWTNGESEPSISEKAIQAEVIEAEQWAIAAITAVK